MLQDGLEIANWTRIAVWCDENVREVAYCSLHQRVAGKEKQIRRFRVVEAEDDDPITDHYVDREAEGIEPEDAVKEWIVGQINDTCIGVATSRSK